MRQTEDPFGNLIGLREKKITGFQYYLNMNKETKNSDF